MLITAKRCENCAWFRSGPSDCTRYPPHTTPIAVGLQASPNPGEPPVPIIRNVISYNLVDKNLPACGEFKQGVIAATNAA